MPPSTEKNPFSLCTNKTLGITLDWSMVGHVGRSWSLATTTCQDSSWTLNTSMVQLALKIGWGIIGGTKIFFNLTTTFGVAPLSHNVFAKQNTIVGWILEMAIVFAKKNGASHTDLVAPNKPTLYLGIKLSTMLDTPQEVNTPMGLGTVFVNTNDYGSHT